MSSSPAHPAPVPVALILIDMQRGMLPENTGPRNNPGAEDNIARLLEAWRARKLPVVHVRHMGRAPGGSFWPGSSNCEFQPRFEPQAHEHRLEKNVNDAFANSGLERWLRLRDISRLVVAGVSTNNSVEATVRAAFCLGFEVTLPGDACYTYDKTDILGVARPAEDWHVTALSNLHGEYATVTSTQAIVAGL
ncbi:cysteine hydrolase family protein [Caulobacter sp. LjRoot300]|jgi:nicotinamidase-related amidase|uniref:cysteine hydrolase family protein n=1 Tax=Caulobacter sp. LjRoot300 TaxID=3342321 RepID=UPI003ECFE8DB